MFRLSCKLLLRFFLILLGVSLISFLLMYLAPGDPAKNMLASQGIPFTKELLGQAFGIWLSGSFLGTVWTMVVGSLPWKSGNNLSFGIFRRKRVGLLFS